MENNFNIDPRYEEADKIISALLSESAIQVSDVMITEDNNLVIVQDNTIMYVIPLKNVVDNWPPIGYSYNIWNLGGKLPNANICGRDVLIEDNILNKLRLYYNNFHLQKYPIVSQNLNLMDNENFLELSNLKASDSMKFFRMPHIDNPGLQSLVPMISGLIKLNKGDTCGITVSQVDEQFLLMNINIYKKKIAREFNMYYKTLKIN